MGASKPKTELDEEYRQLVSQFLERTAAEKKWSQEVLGKAMGISRSMANRYLGGTVQAPLQNLLLLEQTSDVVVPRAIRAAFNALSGIATPEEPPVKPAQPARRRLSLKPSRAKGGTLVPVISWVSAGELTDPTIQLPADLRTLEIDELGDGEFFATEVRGDSMDRIAPEGALLVVNRSEINLVRGRRYIFNLRGQTTFKRYGEDPPALLPESLNPAHEPRILKPADKWSVVGRVRKVIIDV